MKRINKTECFILDFPKIKDPRGNLTFLQNPDQIPFEIKRVFWIYDVPGGEKRGGHAYKSQCELIVALSGSFDVIITDNNGDETKHSLNRSYYGLFIPANTWRHIENLSTNALSLHLSSSEYNENDYIYNFDEFINMEKS
jgi:hypothetical protein